MVILHSRLKLWVVLSAALTAVLLALVINIAEVDAIFRNWRSLDEYRGDIFQLEERRGDLGRDLDFLAPLGNEKKLIESSFMNSGDPLLFIESIERKSRDLGLRAELTLGSGNSGQYNLKISGDFHKIVAFIKSIEYSPVLVETGDLEIVRAGPVGGSKVPSASSLVELTIAIRPLEP